MKRIKQFATTVAAAAVAATLFGASAFAEERHDDRTRGRNDNEWRDRRGDAGVQQRGDDSRWRDSRRDDRRDDRRGNVQPHYAQGRITRVEPFGSDYRVWVGGSRYPFHVPSSHYRRNRSRWGIGVEIRIGGVYNPRGYYDYYDDYGYRDGRRSGYLRGVVTEVNHRRDLLEIRDEQSGHRIRVEMEGRDRTFNHVRRGDYIELEGRWDGRRFEAYRADILDSRRDRRW